MNLLELKLSFHDAKPCSHCSNDFCTHQSNVVNEEICREASKPSPSPCFHIFNCYKKSSSTIDHHNTTVNIEIKNIKVIILLKHSRRMSKKHIFLLLLHHKYFKVFDGPYLRRFLQIKNPPQMIRIQLENSCSLFLSTSILMIEHFFLLTMRPFFPIYTLKSTSWATYQSLLIIQCFSM